MKTRESSLDLRFLLYQPDQDEIPVSSSPSLFFSKSTLQINLSKSFSALQKRAALLSAAAVELHRLRLRLRFSSTCLITSRKKTHSSPIKLFISPCRICVIAVAVAVRSAHGVSPPNLFTLLLHMKWLSHFIYLVRFIYQRGNGIFLLLPLSHGGCVMFHA